MMQFMMQAYRIDLQSNIVKQDAGKKIPNYGFPSLREEINFSHN